MYFYQFLFCKMKQEEKWKKKNKEERNAKHHGNTWSHERQRHMLRWCEDTVQHAEKGDPRQGSDDRLGIPMTRLLRVWQKSHRHKVQLFNELHKEGESLYVWVLIWWRQTKKDGLNHTAFFFRFYCQKAVIFTWPKRFLKNVHVCVYNPSQSDLWGINFQFFLFPFF